MIRWVMGAIGAVFVAALAFALFGTISGWITAPPAPLVGESKYHKEPKELHLASDGPFGTFDTRQLQRGFQVYKEVCSACHSLRLVAFRDLSGLGYSPAEIKAIAQQWSTEQPTTNPDTGEATTRKNLPADHFPSPFANETAARAANNNALPPDLSLIVKAREGGPRYVYSILTGYQNPPAQIFKDFPDFTVPNGLHYNPYFPTMNIAMAQQLHTEGQVQYEDGTRPTVDQMAQDVTAFLVWAAEPTLATRHAVGMAAVLFLLALSALAYGAYRNVWRDMAH